MKWRVWLAIGLLVFATSTGVLIQRRIENLCTELCASLQDRHIEEEFQKAKQMWEEKATMLSIWIRHDRVDYITESFAKAEAFLKSDTEDEFRAELAQLMSKIKLLKQYDHPDLRSIF